MLIIRAPGARSRLRRGSPPLPPPPPPPRFAAVRRGSPLPPLPPPPPRVFMRFRLVSLYRNIEISIYRYIAIAPRGDIAPPPSHFRCKVTPFSLIRKISPRLSLHPPRHNSRFPGRDVLAPPLAKFWTGKRALSVWTAQSPPLSRPNPSFEPSKPIA